MQPSGTPGLESEDPFTAWPCQSESSPYMPTALQQHTVLYHPTVYTPPTEVLTTTKEMCVCVK